MTVRSGDVPGTILSRRPRRLVGIALALPAFLLAGLLALPSAATAGVPPSGPDLTVTISHTPEPVAPGGTVTFTVLVSNDGSLDSFDTGLEFSTGGDAVLDAQVTDGSGEECDWEGTSASCDLGHLPTSTGSNEAMAPLLASNEAEAVIQVQAPDASGTEFLSDATASSVDQTDEHPSDNTDDDLTNVSESGSDSGMVPPGGSLSTLNGPLNAADPFAVGLRNVGSQTLDATIEEEPCDGSQEGDLCNVPRVGGVAGDFMFQSVGGGLLSPSATAPPIVVAKLFYDKSVLGGVDGFQIFWQETTGGAVLLLPHCGRHGGPKTECFRGKEKRNGDQVVRIPLSHDPKFTRG